MNKTVVTTFDNTYWKKWGVSWLGSLKQFGKFDGQVVVIDNNDDLEIAPSVCNKYAIDIVKPVKQTGFRDVDRLFTVADLAAKTQGVYVSYDGDIYFQDDINPLWDAISDKLVFGPDGMIGGDLDPLMYGYGYIKPIVPDARSQQRVANAVKVVADTLGHTAQGGMVGGSSESWQVYSTFLRYCFDTERVKPVYLSDQLALNLYASFFPKLVAMLPETWNCIVKASMRWKQDGFYIDDAKVKAIHLAGVLKDTSEGRQYMFKERFKSEYDEWRTAITKPGAIGPRTFTKHAGGKTIKLYQRKKGLPPHLDKRWEFSEFAGASGLLEVGGEIPAVVEGGEDLIDHKRDIPVVDAKR